MTVSQEELEAKAREINDAVLGPDRKESVKLLDAVKKRADLGAKFALEKALNSRGISEAGKKAFVELLREQKDAINILLVSAGQKQKAIEMLKPIFGYKSKEFLENFQDIFKKLQVEISLDLQKQEAV